MGYSQWGGKESGTTERLTLSHNFLFPHQGTGIYIQNIPEVGIIWNIIKFVSPQVNVVPMDLIMKDFLILHYTLYITCHMSHYTGEKKHRNRH